MDAGENGMVVCSPMAALFFPSLLFVLLVLTPFALLSRQLFRVSNLFFFVLLCMLLLLLLSSGTSYILNAVVVNHSLIGISVFSTVIIICTIFIIIHIVFVVIIMIIIVNTIIIIMYCYDGHVSRGFRQL